MHRLRRNFLLEGLKAFDTLGLAASVGVGLFASAALPRHGAFTDFLSERVSVRNALLMAGFLAASHLVFERCRLYRSHRLGSRRELYGRIVQAVTVAAMLLGGLAVLCRIEAFDRSFLAAFWVAAVALLVSSRLVLYRALEFLRARGRNLRRVLIVGAGPRGRRFAQTLKSHAELGYEVVGFLDEASNAAHAGDRYLGELADLPRLLRNVPLDEVVVALPLKTFYAEVSRIVCSCERQGVVVRVPGDLFEAQLARVECEQFEDLGVVTLSTLPGPVACYWIKRGLDVAMAAVALVALGPLLMLVALAVRLDSAGPALFSQLRVGHNGRRFRIWKFRTMLDGAENRQLELEQQNEVHGAAFKIRRDPRVTRLGRWLRRTSLDEMPQLLNVLTGDMSLVGPRPLPLRDVDRLSEDWQRRRFSVRPGLTCLWQAGGRHRIGFEDWMRLDLDYIDNWSLLLDLKILLRTVPAVWSGAGAS